MATALQVPRASELRYQVAVAERIRTRKAMLRGEGDFERARLDPEWFMRDWLGADPYDKQVEILEAIRDHRRVSVRGCHSAGKDFITARVVLWFLHAFVPSVVITTAPTANQVENVLWREMRTAVAQSRKALMGRCLVRKYEIGPQHFALGFKASDTQPDRFQGFHSTNLLVVVDEAAGVPDPIYDALESLLSSEGARELIIGNSTSTSGRFYDTFHARRALYHGITIPASETPNLLAGQVVRPYLITQQWIDEVTEENGADSAYVQSRVHAQFPDQEQEGVLIPLSSVEAAHEREHTPTTAALEAGVDVARYGASESGIAIRQGPNVLEELYWSKMDTMETVGKITHILDRYPDPRSILIKVDVVGLGAGVVDRLREKRYNVRGVNVGHDPTDKEKYRLLRDELWWSLADRFRDGSINGPFTQKTIAQLSSVRYHYDSRHTRPLIESKEEAMEKRRVVSPDRGDTIMLAFAQVKRGSFIG